MGVYFNLKVLLSVGVRGDEMINPRYPVEEKVFFSVLCNVYS